MKKEKQLNDIRLRIKYKVTFEDYLKYTIKNVYKLYIIVYFFFLMIRFIGSNDLAVSIIRATISYIFLLAISCFIIKIKYLTNKSMKQETIIEVNDNSITEINDFLNSTVKLEGIYRFKEDSSCYYIYINYGKVLIIPKRYLSLKEHEIFKEIISKNFKEKIKFRKTTDFKDKESKYNKAFKMFLLIFHFSLIAITILAFMGLGHIFNSDNISYYPLYITDYRYISYMCYILPLSILSIVLRNHWILSKHKM